jgi:hypothetical protein
MGEKSHRVADDSRRDSPLELQRLESEIARSRHRLDAYVDELDRRRHRLLSVRAHPGVAVGAAVGGLSVIAASVLLLRRRRRRIPRARARAEAFRDAFERVTRHPERVAREKNTSSWAKLLIAAAPAVVRILRETSRRRR